MEDSIALMLIENKFLISEKTTLEGTYKSRSFDGVGVDMYEPAVILSAYKRDGAVVFKCRVGVGEAKREILMWAKDVVTIDGMQIETFLSITQDMQKAKEKVRKPRNKKKHRKILSPEERKEKRRLRRLRRKMLKEASTNV